MQKIIFLLLLVIFSPLRTFAQADSLVELAVLDSVLRRFQTPMQHFRISASQPSRTIGAKGIIIDIKPEFFHLKSGKPLGDSIDIELKELTKLSEVMKNVVLMPNFELASSAYYVMLKSGGEQLCYKSGSEAIIVSVYKKIQRRTGYKLLNFSGITSGNFPILLNGSRGIDSRDSATTGMIAKGQMAYYDPFRLRCLGWMTCLGDNGIGDPLITEINLTFDDNNAHVNYVSAYLIFNDGKRLQHKILKTTGIKNGFPIYMSDREKDKGGHTLICIGVKNGKAYTFKHDFIISQKDFETHLTIPVTLEPTTKAEVAKLFTLK